MRKQTLILLTSVIGLNACAEEFQGSYFERQEQKAIAQDFVGVRTSDGVEKNLYQIKATGVSTKPIADSAQAFITALSDEQKQRTLYPVDDVQWRKWLNVDNGIYTRQGVSLKEMTAEQKAKAFALIESSLSARGLEQTRNIMKTDQTLKELNGGTETLDEELYFFTVMGSPSLTEPWGWQVDGHHLAINYFVLGDQVVFSPAFMGAEPVFTTSGKYQGNVLFQDEQNLGLALMTSLDKNQQQKALLGEKSGEDMKAAGFQDNLVLDYQGIRGGELSAQQQQDLLTLIEQYVGKMREGHVQVKMAEVQQHLDNTWFAWRGATDEKSVFYYRIHSPVVLIEFDHQRPIGIRVKGNRREATRNHIHTMIRTPNGNDYGKSLLQQHINKYHQNGTTHSHEDGTTHHH